MLRGCGGMGRLTWRRRATGERVPNEIRVNHQAERLVRNQTTHEFIFRLGLGEHSEPLVRECGALCAVVALAGDRRIIMEEDVRGGRGLVMIDHVPPEHARHGERAGPALATAAAIVRLEYFICWRSR